MGNLILWMSDTEDMPGSGDLTPRFMVVGESPTKIRDIHHQSPLGPKSMQLLRSAAAQFANGDGTRVYYTNLVKQPRPKSGRKSTKLKVAEIREWMPVLEAEIAALKPERILTLGASVSKALLGKIDIREDHGAFFTRPDGIIVIPTYSLVSTVSQPELADVVARDLERFFGLDDPGQAPEYRIVSSLDELPRFKGQTLVIDIETNGLNLECEIHAIGISNGEEFWILKGDGDYGSPISASVVDRLGERMYEDSVVLIGHNIKFDLFQLAGHCPMPENSGWAYLPTIDTMLLAHNTGREHNLRLKHLMTIHTDLIGSHAGGDVYSPDYLALDLAGTWELYNTLQNELQRPSARLMCDMSGILGIAQARGIYIDREVLSHLDEEISLESERLYEALTAFVGRDINWNSPQQVSEALRQIGVPLTTKTKSGNVSVAEGVLLELRDEHPVVATLLEYRANAKLHSGFIRPYVESGAQYVRPSLLLHGTETGRLSCRDPNLQQIPRQGKFKTIFRPRWPDGFIGLIDLSQAELRMAAFLSDDWRFAEALLEEDAHRAIASIVFNKPQDEIDAAERKASKAITFGTLYGGTAAGLAARAGIPVERAELVQRELFEQFRGLRNWANGFKRYVKAEKNPVIETPFGRRRDLRYIRMIEGPEGAYRKAINTGPQSMASDIMLHVCRSIWNLSCERGLRSRPLFLVHDSTISEIYPGEQFEFARVVQEAFKSLWDTPLGDYKMFHTLPCVGELIIGKTWAHVESTNEAYDPLWTFSCSSNLPDEELVDPGAYHEE